MKKILFAAVALIATTIATSTAQGIYYGPKVGLNLTSLTKASNATNLVRGSVGGFAGYQITDVLSAQAEVLFSWQGADKIDGEKLRLSYLKVPLLAKMSLWGNLSAEAGVSLNFLLSSKLADKSVSGLNTFDFSVPIGVSYLIQDQFEIGLRYDIALTNVGLKSSSNAKNNVWFLSFGYRF